MRRRVAFLVDTARRNLSHHGFAPEEPLGQTPIAAYCGAVFGFLGREFLREKKPDIPLRHFNAALGRQGVTRLNYPTRIGACQSPNTPCVPDGNDPHRRLRGRSDVE